MNDAAPSPESWLKRCARVVFGVLLMTATMPLVILPLPGMEVWAWWLVVLTMAAKVGGGLVLVLVALRQYEHAAFPPGGAALTDPVSLWFVRQSDRLWQWCWPLWFLAQLLILFVPVLFTAFLVLMALRPFYVTLRQQPPTAAFFWREARRTLGSLWATATGLFLLSVGSLLGTGCALATMAWLLYHAPR